MNYAANAEISPHLEPELGTFSVRNEKKEGEREEENGTHKDHKEQKGVGEERKTMNLLKSTEKHAHMFCIVDQDDENRGIVEVRILTKL